MKSILQGPKEEKNKAIEFPCLMISPKSGNVLLVTEMDNEGCCNCTVVHSPNDSLYVGSAYESLSGVNLQPLKGKIILSN